MTIKTINSNALYIKQLITKYLVFSYSNNISRFNGKLGRRFSIQLRSNTNL
jgi:hypothetical protein